MGIEELEGRVFANRPYRLCAEKVTEFVDVTGDDPQRWHQVAPPGMAASLLFVVAPELLADPSVSGAVVHGEQSFTWHRALRVESDLAVTGTVDRIRDRGGVSFVTFLLSALDGDDLVVEGKSTFLVGASVGDGSAEVANPSADDRGPTSPVSATVPAARSASRADLIRYAAATRDWNPIHWDHPTAVEAGLGGIVVHGLLQSAWLTQVAASANTGELPLESARFRYKSPLRPGESAEIRGEVKESEADLSLVVAESVTVTGRFAVRT